MYGEIPLNKWLFMRGALALCGLMMLTMGIWGVAAQDTPPVIGFATNTPLPVNNAPATATPTPQPVTDTATSEIVIDTTSDYEPVVMQMPPECAYMPGQPTNQACIDYMNQYPEPDVQRINQDTYTLGQYSFWRVGPHAVTKFSAPNGGVSGTIPEGFNFINATNTSVEGWLQIEGGEWIRRSDAYFVQPSYFTGVMLPDDWRKPFGWILDITGIYASLYPGGPSTSETGLVPRHYEMFNIYAEAVDDEGWTWYLVGPNQWVKQIYMTVIQPVERPEGVSGRWVAVDLFEQSLVAYEDNRPVFATLISTGLPGTETNEGLFEVWARLDRDGMSGATGAPNAYALQSVPWVLYFDNAISLHGTYWHDTFGYRRSRGCVNLSISDARWVYDWTANASTPTTFVYVYSSGEYRA